MNQWLDQEDSEGRGHWYKLRNKDIEEPDYRYNGLPTLWKEAIKNPGVRQEVTWTQGTGPGSICTRFALYDPEKRMMLAGHYDCPNMYGHHLYETCWCCGQYG